MRKVVMLVAFMVVLGLPNSLFAYREKNIESNLVDTEICVVPTVDKGEIRIKKTVQKLDWFRFRHVTTTVYEELKPGSEPSPDARLIISCDDGYSITGDGENPLPIACEDGYWQPSPICIKNVFCGDPQKPEGTFITFLPPSNSKSSFAHSFFGELEDPSEEIMPVSATKDSKKLSVPAGFHLRGTRAIYGCKSKYYKLYGSRVLRCQEEGKWSGFRPFCIPICGRPSSSGTPLISYGNATSVGQWPWQAALSEYFPSSDKWYFKCGGALLNERWVITAAHCVTYRRSSFPLPPEELKVYLGKYHLNDTQDDKYVQVKMVVDVVVSSKYNYSELDADIALLKLESPVKMNSRIQPICLPTEDTSRLNLVEGRKLVVTGWGANENNTLSETLQQAVLPVVSNAKCLKGFQNANFSLIVTDYMFCAGYDKGHPDTCKGDSGGPVVFEDPTSEERKWVIEGIVSWGSPSGCGTPYQYGVYTTVSKFLNWIRSYI